MYLCAGAGCHANLASACSVAEVDLWCWSSRMAAPDVACSATILLHDSRPPTGGHAVVAPATAMKPPPETLWGLQCLCTRSVGASHLLVQQMQAAFGSGVVQGFGPKGVWDIPAPFKTQIPWPQRLQHAKLQGRRVCQCAGLSFLFLSHSLLLPGLIVHVAGICLGLTSCQAQCD